MTMLTRQTMLADLAAEQTALMDFVSRVSDEEWRTLTRDDGWSIHDIVAHIADVYLTTVATSGVARRSPRAVLAVTLPMLPSGRVNTERLNMIRYETNRKLSRDEVMERLAEAFELLSETVNGLKDKQLNGPGPFGLPETMLDWFNAAIVHHRRHRLQLEHIYTTRA